MEELKDLISQISDNVEVDGKKLKNLMMKIVDYCEFELENRDRRHKTHLTFLEYRYRAEKGG